MGYYIDFVFNPEDNLDNEILIKFIYPAACCGEVHFSLEDAAESFKLAEEFLDGIKRLFT